MMKHAEGAEDLSAELAALRQDIARLAETVRDLASHQAQAAGQRIADAIGSAKDKIGSAAADARSSINAAGGELTASIERNPVTAVLIALAVGLSLGMLSRSRS